MSPRPWCIPSSQNCCCLSQAPDELLPFPHCCFLSWFLGKHLPHTKMLSLLFTVEFGPALPLWAAIPALIPQPLNRRQVNSVLPGEKYLCIPWMTQMCNTVTTAATDSRHFAGACPRNCQNLLKWKQLLLSKQFFGHEGQLAAQTLAPVQNPVVTKCWKWLKFWKMLFFVCLFT